jgi:hypothetical protein
MRFIIMLGMLTSNLQAAETVPFEIAEKTGLRRYGYPISAQLKLPREITKEDRFRLMIDGKPFAAQIEARTGKDVAIYLNMNLAPFEVKRGTIEFGPDVQPVMDVKGITLEETEKTIEVKQSSGLTFTFSKDARNPLLSVKTKEGTDYLSPNSTGFRFRTPNQDKWSIFPAEMKTEVTILSRGPNVAVIRYRLVPWKGNKDLPFTILATVPNSKSWVEFVLMSGDPRQISTELKLNLEGEPLIADFGVDDGVYLTIKKNEASSLTRTIDFAPAETRVNWKLESGQLDKLQPFAKSQTQRVAIGSEVEIKPLWMHAMDKKKAIALAGKNLQQIDFSGDGKLRWISHLQLTERFFLHFVSMPVQIGALTSPQSMINPPEMKTTAPIDKIK